MSMELKYCVNKLLVLFMHLLPLTKLDGNGIFFQDNDNNIKNSLKACLVASCIWRCTAINSDTRRNTHSQFPSALSHPTIAVTPSNISTGSPHPTLAVTPSNTSSGSHSTIAVTPSNTSTSNPHPQRAIKSQGHSV